MNTGVLVPAVLGGGIIVTRAVIGQKRAPYPYELLSWAAVFGAAGMIGESAPQFGQMTAWAYLVAMLLAPSNADVLKLLPTGKAVPAAPKGSSGQATVTGKAA
jgi:hypothetical protein